jgi:hypothetical protein
MITIPNSEESGRKILLLFVNKFKCRPDHILLHSNLLSQGIPKEDLEKGLEFAEQKGWIEKTKGNQYKLTELGFSQAEQNIK